MKKSKVLYICPNGYLGGAERIVCNAALGHIKSGLIDFEVLFFSKGEAVELCRKNGAKVHVLPMTFKMKRIDQLFTVIKYIRNYVLTNEFNIIHSTMPYSHVIAFLSTIFIDIKKTWFQHGPVGGLLDSIANLLPVDRIYFNTKYLESEHLKMSFSGRRRSLHKLVHCGILENKSNTERVKEIRGEFATNDDDFLVLSAGRLCVMKGQDVLIDAIKETFKNNEKWKKKVKVLLIGNYGREEDKVYADKLKEKIKLEGLEESILMLGHKNDIENYYSACDIFIHSTTIPEPFGLVVAESMRNNCLVIGSDVGGVTDILKDGETGFTYPSTSKEAALELAKTFEKVFSICEDDPSRITEIKSTAKNLIDNEYSISSMTNVLERDYEELLK